MPIFIFFLGLIVGSFLNAVIFRLHSGETIWADRSHCMHCHHKLNALDLIPVFSFVFLGGRCRYCGKRISFQYPLVEIITAIVFYLLSTHYSIFTIHFWFYAVAASFLIVIAVYDLKHYLILDKVVYPALVLTLVWSIINGQLLNGILGALIVSGFFAIQYFISKGRWIGFGDVKLGLVLGSILGWKFGIVMLVIAYFLGAIVGVGLILMGRKQLGSKLPFGVFLCISAIIMMIYGGAISDWYLGLIGF